MQRSLAWDIKRQKYLRAKTVPHDPEDATITFHSPIDESGCLGRTEKIVMESTLRAHVKIKAAMGRLEGRIRCGLSRIMAGARNTTAHQTVEELVRLSNLTEQHQVGATKELGYSGVPASFMCSQCLRVFLTEKR